MTTGKLTVWEHQPVFSHKLAKYLPNNLTVWICQLLVSTQSNAKMNSLRQQQQQHKQWSQPVGSTRVNKWRIISWIDSHCNQLSDTTRMFDGIQFSSMSLSLSAWLWRNMRRNRCNPCKGGGGGRGAGRHSTSSTKRNQAWQGQRCHKLRW